MTQQGTLLLDASQVRTKNHNLISFYGHPQVLIKKILLRTCIFAIRAVHHSLFRLLQLCSVCHAIVP
jgi:hypothetical protein